jgi:hypothetical protein
MGPVIFQKSFYEGLEFIQVAEGMRRKCDALDFKFYVGIIRRLYQRRNEFIREGIFTHPNSILKQAMENLEAYEQVQGEELVSASTGLMNAPPAMYKWVAPPFEWFKANWDAAVGRAIGRLGVGIIIRDHHGEFQAAKSWTRLGLLDPTASEAMAAYMAIKMCTKLGLQKIQLEGDTQNVVEAVNKREKK